MHIRGFLTFIFLVISGTLLIAQPGYKIEFKIKGWKDTTAYLGFYNWDQTFVKDTAKVNGQGDFFFDNPKSLTQGVYFLMLNKSIIFDFVVGTDQHFKLETSSEDFISTMKVSGDVDNELYFGDMVFNKERNKEVEPYIKVLRDSTLAKDDPSKKAAQESL